jgi:hypothetical protein
VRLNTTRQTIRAEREREILVVFGLIPLNKRCCLNRTNTVRKKRHAYIASRRTTISSCRCCCGAICASNCDTVSVDPMVNNRRRERMILHCLFVCFWLVGDKICDCRRTPVRHAHRQSTHLAELRNDAVALCGTLAGSKGQVCHGLMKAESCRESIWVGQQR